MLAGQQIEAMYGVSTSLPDFDFETFSESGFLWGTEPGYWKKAPKKKPPGAVLDPSGHWLWVPPTVRLEPLPGAGKRYGLNVVGTYNYVTHETFHRPDLAPSRVLAHFAAERLRDELVPEADAQEGSLGANNLPHEPLGAHHPRSPLRHARARIRSR